MALRVYKSRVNLQNFVEQGQGVLTNQRPRANNSFITLCQHPHQQESAEYN